MKTALFHLLAPLSIPGFIPAAAESHRPFNSQMLLQKQEDEMWAEYDRCDEEIERIDGRIAELHIEIPRLKKLAIIQKSLRIITWPLRLLRNVVNGCIRPKNFLRSKQTTL